MKIKPLASIMLLSAVAIANLTFASALPATAADADGSLADDTLLLLLAPHTDRHRVEKTLLSAARVSVAEDIHVNGDDYSILALQAPPGMRESALASIQSLMPQHPEFLEIERNYVVPDAVSVSDMPNDTNFSQQWPLANMKWTQAYTNFASQQKQSARITILTGGCDPVSTNNELGAYITEYDTTVKDVKTEPLHTNSSEGDIDCSISGCLTNNNTLIAGAACFNQSMPCYITLLRIVSNGSKNASNRNIHRALTWAINNQTARGGQGPVNLSYGGSAGPNPLFHDTIIQTLAKSLVNHGDILVMAAGDKSAVQTKVTDTGNAVVVQATAKNNSFDTHHTQIQNDPCGAPGAAQPAVIKGMYNDRHDGSSFSAPLWSSAIAMLISFNPSLTAYQAQQIILSTGTPVVGSSWTAYIPNFQNAISQAISLLQ